MPAPVGAARTAQVRSAVRILGWATLAALVVGALGLMQPIEDAVREARNKLRPQKPSGQIVAIGIDDRSLEGIGSWPWSRRRHVELIDRLNAAGVRRIFYDVSFATASTPSDDRAFVAALKRSSNVYLAAMRVRDPKTGERHYKLPRPEYRAHARVVSVAVHYSRSSEIREMDVATDLGGTVAPTMSAELALVRGPVDDSFTIDYAISPRHIPYVSAIDVLEPGFDVAQVRGKDVVIGAATAEMGDVYYVPGYGQINGMFVNIVAAETLRAGGTVQYGWVVPLVAGILLCAIHLFSRRRWLSGAALVIAVAGVTVLPLFAEMRGVFYDIMPVLVLVGASAGSRAWSNFRRSYKVRGNINANSGLPNLNALRGETPAADAVVVGARVRNFAEISSSLPPEGERALVDQIVARLALGARGARIYQGDEGIFVWTTTPEVAGADQLDALHALFRSPALVDGRPIDLSVTLGIDADGSRTLANRIGATLVAADEASVEGLRWKAYDPPSWPMQNGNCRCSGGWTPRSTVARSGWRTSRSWTSSRAGCRVPRRWSAGRIPKRARSARWSSCWPPNSTTASTS